MSRCFLFPPPGYEKKKARSDDTDLLKEEKSKEKKLKKGKKDKEKREGKEKKKKERSKGKHQENKDKKERHKDKKDKYRNKDKKKEKEKSRGINKDRSTDKTICGAQVESNNGEKVHQKEVQIKNINISEETRPAALQLQSHNCEKPIQASLQGEAEASKIFHVRDEKNGAGSQSFKRFTGSNQKNDETRGFTVRGAGLPGEGMENNKYNGVSKQNGENPIQACLQGEAEFSKFLSESGKRSSDVEKEATVQSFERVTGNNQEKDETRRFTVRDTGILGEGIEKNRDNRVSNSKEDGQGSRTESRFIGNTMVQNLADVQKKVEEIPKSMENIERKVDGKGNSRDRVKRDKHKGNAREKKNHGKNKEREKEKKKDEKAREKSECMKTVQDKFKDINKNNRIAIHSNKCPHLPKDGAAEVNIKKRKEAERNGFLLESGGRQSKLPRPLCHEFVENGRMVESQTPILHTSDWQGEANNVKVEKDYRANGMIEAQPFSVSASKPLPSVRHADQISEASNAPHPDFEHLSQVLSLPRMEEWSDFDDQDWLFGCNYPSSKKFKVSCAGVSENLQVWAEAVHIESADVCALPYVLPY